MSNIISLGINAMSLQHHKGFWSIVFMQREFALMKKNTPFFHFASSCSPTGEKMSKAEGHSILSVLQS